MIQLIIWQLNKEGRRSNRHSIFWSLEIFSKVDDQGKNLNIQVIRPMEKLKLRKTAESSSDKNIHLLWKQCLYINYRGRIIFQSCRCNPSLTNET